jgi:hypothetical protein
MRLRTGREITGTNARYPTKHGNVMQIIGIEYHLMGKESNEVDYRIPQICTLLFHRGSLFFQYDVHAGANQF